MQTIHFNRIQRYGKTYLHPANEAAEKLISIFPPKKKCFDHDKLDTLTELGFQVYITDVTLDGLRTEKYK